MGFKFPSVLYLSFLPLSNTLWVMGYQMETGSGDNAYVYDIDTGVWAQREDELSVPMQNARAVVYNL